MNLLCGDWRGQPLVVPSACADGGTRLTALRLPASGLQPPPGAGAPLLRLAVHKGSSSPSLFAARMRWLDSLGHAGPPPLRMAVPKGSPSPCCRFAKSRLDSPRARAPVTSAPGLSRSPSIPGRRHEGEDWNWRSVAFARKLSVGKFASKAYAMLGFQPPSGPIRNPSITAIGSPSCPRNDDLTGIFCLTT